MSSSLDVDPQFLIEQRHEWLKGAREARLARPGSVALLGGERDPDVGVEE